MNVVVVESPAKAKTINKYLGGQYEVLASYGHVRDLPSKDGSVDPDNGFAMVWEVDGRSRKNIADIAKALKGADKLYLATDPDREGEAISWHVQELLRDSNALKGVAVERVVFHEITKDAILEAVSHPRPLNTALVDAYLARRALDYLVGFTLSPVLWRKLPGSRSAGRVQSVALRLICEREAEIEAFKSQEYWTVAGKFRNTSGVTFQAQLTHLNGHKLGKFDLATAEAAKQAVSTVESFDYAVHQVETKRVKRNPAPPFTTSTLQQEAARKLNLRPQRTMQIAQKLYEGVDIGGETVGLITYMRTDAVTLSGEALAGCRRLIEKQYGNNYLPPQPRQYKTKTKNAQEAHEAIRPTDVSRLPSTLRGHLNNEQLRLYELIWKRTVASQMASAEFDQMAVDLAPPRGTVVLRANGSAVAFDGFLALYSEGRDDSDDDERDRRLPPLKKGEAVERGFITPEQHFTQPPPRFTEASLVKEMEKLGIGRPSTYASVLAVLQERNYVTLDSRRLVPEDRGRLVTTFLKNFFSRYVEYTFTADLEDQLDDISNGKVPWQQVLQDFWRAFNTAVEGTRELRVRDVLDTLDEELGPHFFPPAEDGSDPRRCPACGDGRLSIKLGKFGAFLGCSAYPECRHTRPLTINAGDQAPTEGNGDLPRELGHDPESHQVISLRKGPFGLYVQRGDGTGADKPKRASLPKGMAVDSIDLARALALLALPRDIAAHPDTGLMIQAGIGRFGPYIKHGSVYVSLKDPEELFSLQANRAIALLAESKKQPAKVLGQHPTEGGEITLRTGRFGPYVQHGAVRANLPKDTANQEPSLETAVALLAAKAERTTGKRTASKGTASKGTAGKGRGKKTASATAKKAKTTTKKSPAKKSTATKSRRKTPQPAEG